MMAVKRGHIMSTNRRIVLLHRAPARRQRGMSKWGWLIAMLLLAGTMTTVLRLGPHYIDFRIVQSVLDDLPKSEVHADMSRAKIVEHFSKQFRIENFRIPVKEMMSIERTRDQTVLDVNYEVREHLLYNIDVVLTFSDQRTYE